MSKQIKYRSGYKYQLAEEYATVTDIRPVEDINTEFISLSSEGVLIVRSGYAWDGPSGPTIDTSDSLRASLEHDVKYQLMRDGLIGQEWRETADKEFHLTCLEDGMHHLRAEAWFLAVRKFAAGAADTHHIKPIMVAP